MKKIFLSSIIVILFSCSAQEVKPPKELDEIAREIIQKAKNCALITVDSLNIAHARTMDPFLPEDDFTIWMATNPKSSKVAQIRNNPMVTLYYFDPIDVASVSLQGEAVLINEKEKKQKLWKKEWENFYKNRTTDYLLIKFTPKKLNLISEKHQILGDSTTWRSPEIKLNSTL